MSHFHEYSPTLADAAFDGSVAGLLCFLALFALLWLGRAVVSLFEAEPTDED